MFNYLNIFNFKINSGISIKLMKNYFHILESPQNHFKPNYYFCLFVIYYVFNIVPKLSIVHYMLNTICAILCQTIFIIRSNKILFWGRKFHTSLTEIYTFTSNVSSALPYLNFIILLHYYLIRNCVRYISKFV